MEQETKTISNLKDRPTEILILKQEISNLQQTKTVSENIDDTIHENLNIKPVEVGASQETQ